MAVLEVSSDFIKDSHFCHFSLNFEFFFKISKKNSLVLLKFLNFLLNIIIEKLLRFGKIFPLRERL